MDPPDPDESDLPPGSSVRNRTVLSDAKGASLLNLHAEAEDPDFPEVFYFKTEEIKLYLRLSWMLAGKILWTEAAPEDTEWLLLLGFCEWYLNLPVTSNLNTKENYFVYHLFDDILNNSSIDAKAQEWNWKGEETIPELQKQINTSASEYGHLTYRHFTSEQTRIDLWNSLIPRILKYRTLQKGRVPSPRAGKSSEYSSHASTDTVPVRYPTPRVKDFDSAELADLISLTPQERKMKINALG